MTWACEPGTGLECVKAHFGTVLHGADIIFYNDPDGTDTAASDLKIEWTQNLYSRLYTYYDSASVADAMWFVGQFDIASTDDQVTIANPDITSPYVHKLPGETDNDNGDGFEAALTPIDFAKDSIVFQMQIDNPASGATPARDGFYAITRNSLAWVKVEDQYTYTPTYSWIPQTSTSNAQQAMPADLIPTADYGIELDTAHEIADPDGADGDVLTPCDNQWQYAKDAEDAEIVPICDESWTIGESGWSCVKLTAKFTRPLARPAATTYTDDNGDDEVIENDLCDFSIDYVSHAIKIQIGAMSEEGETGYVRFEQTVDFNNFLSTTTVSADDATALASSLVVTLFAMFALFKF